MSSGVKFSEEYDGRDDLSRFASSLGRTDTVQALKAWNEREVAQGERFRYASIETQVLAAALRAATGRNLSDYLDDRLWKPMGAEADATWAIASDGLERAGGNFSATLRDWGRLAMLLANDGKQEDRQIVPRDYLIEATDWHRHPAAFAPGKATPGYGYGYQFWIFPGESRRFALLGVYGQAIFIDPASKLVLVQTAVAKTARIGREPMGKELNALWNALLSHYAR
jgi:CubicO group peptidase (beta-lactamase class C family)